MTDWPRCSGPMASQHFMVGACHGRGLFTSWWLIVEEKGIRIPQSPLWARQQWLQTSHEAPSPKGSPLLSNAELGTEPWTHGPLWGALQIRTQQAGKTRVRLESGLGVFVRSEGAHFAIGKTVLVSFKQGADRLKCSEDAQVPYLERHRIGT